MKKKVLVVAGVALCAALYASPYVSLHNLGKAVDEGDAVALGDHVDFSAVRESLKGSLAPQIADKMNAQGDSPLAGLGSMLATGLLNTLVDQMVTPQGIAAMLKQGKVGTPKPAAPAPAAEPKSAATITKGYKGWDRFEVRVRRADEDGAITATLRRENLFFWKLKSIEMQLPN